MSEHTGGTWTFKVALNGDCGISAQGTGVFIEAFAEIRHSGENARDEAKANARLISAAPDLLEALRPLASIANAILGEAPATADNFSIFQDCTGHAHRVTMDELRAVVAAIAKAEQV